jgi:two-component system, NtrC family, response regulator HydG
MFNKLTMNVSNTNILIIEDDKEFVSWMKRILSPLGDIHIDEGYSESDFYKYFKPGKYNLIILDLRLKSEYEGMNLLDFALNEDPEAPIIILTGYASVETAVRSLKLGAKDYLEKKYFKEDKQRFTKEFLKKVNSIIIEDKVRKLSEQKQKESSPENPIIGENINIKKILEMADLYADKKLSPVYIMGEFGTEKEQLAEYIYKRSDARGKFIKKIIFSKSNHITEELFGNKNKEGLIEKAKAGALYLGNVFNLPIEAKKYLLDFLDTGVLKKQSVQDEFKIKNQIILSSSLVHSEDFYETDVDKKLYYRFKTAPIVIPALRERKEDIPLIAQYFLNKLKSEGKINIENFSDQVIGKFKSYSWPGNIYELEQVVESSAMEAALNKNKTIKLEHLPFEPYEKWLDNNGSKSVDLDKILNEMFLRYLEMAIERTGGAKLKAYECLGYQKNQRGTLNNRVKTYFKEYPEFKRKYPKIHKLYIN